MMNFSIFSMLILSFSTTAYAKEIPFDQNIDYVLKHNPKPVILEFSEPWCIECKLAEPFVNELKKQKNFDIVILENSPRSLQTKLHLKGFPTFFLVKKGKLYDSIVGYGNPKIFNVDYFKNWILYKGE